ncbi:hypothetical protein [Thermocrinis minervae]|uniref:Uncharacterized protein n=1 Tax=Thermocrinis minervae TaxID=381751 RepID=A0A1M6TBY2_9AQUI|nr:hypothetical protein [Thermocrinis minervae]SHK54552.1 hypothetical protein SAMN05444391_1392 [Thermocrinis minervae]
MVKVLIVLYESLKEDVNLLSKLEETVKALKRFIGPDSLYITLTSQFKELFDRFPDLVFINNDKGSKLYAIYKGLRKLRGNNVLVVDGGTIFLRDKALDFISKKKNMILKRENLWGGLAYIKLVDLDYFIRTIERMLEEEVDLMKVVDTVHREYGIECEISS